MRQVYIPDIGIHVVFGIKLVLHQVPIRHELGQGSGIASGLYQFGQFLYTVLVYIYQGSSLVLAQIWFLSVLGGSLI